MNAPRFASLSGSLLARKGGAKPAMRSSAISQGPLLDDCGWNDMGFEDGPALSDHVPSSISALTPSPRSPLEETPVHAQQRALTERFREEPAAVAPDPPGLPPPRPMAQVVSLPRRQPRADGKKAAFTLRLDSDRHLRLRLATAVSGRSAQQLVTAALDEFLESLPELATMAGQLPGRTGKGN
jgi:hypothetical protein